MGRYVRYVPSRCWHVLTGQDESQPWDAVPPVLSGTIASGGSPTA